MELADLSQYAVQLPIAATVRAENGWAQVQIHEYLGRIQPPVPVHSSQQALLGSCCA